MSMKRMRLLLVTPLLASLMAVLIVAGCSSASKPEGASQPSSSAGAGASNGTIQSNTGGSVTIEAKLVGHQNDSLVFEVAMDTHSVNLDSYDLKQLAVLRDGKGNEYKAVSWDAASGSHHRSGKLVFAHADQSAKSLELIVRNVAGVNERVLRWQVSG